MGAKKRYSSKRADTAQRLPFSGRNFALFAIAIVFILLGFVVLSSGDITIAPILLVFGYCVVLPIGILIKPKFRTAKANSGQKKES